MLTKMIQLNSTRCQFCVIAIALFGVASCAQAAAGIKGRPQQASESQRVQAIKGPAALRPQPQQQQVYLPPPPPVQAIELLPPPPPPPALAPLPLPPQAPAPIFQQAIKGAGQVAPTFTAARVQPVIVQQQQQEPIVQQQQQQEQEPESSQQQVQQQAEEVEPSPAAQDNAPAVAVPVRASEEESGYEVFATPSPDTTVWVGNGNAVMLMAIPSAQILTWGPESMAEALAQPQG